MMPMEKMGKMMKVMPLMPMLGMTFMISQIITSVLQVVYLRKVAAKLDGRGSSSPWTSGPIDRARLLAT